MFYTTLRESQYTLHIITLFSEINERICHKKIVRKRYFSFADWITILYYPEDRCGLCLEIRTIIEKNQESNQKPGYG